MTTSHDIDRMIAELTQAGWKPKGGPTYWQAPNGRLYLGPAGAWKIMKSVGPDISVPGVVVPVRKFRKDPGQELGAKKDGASWFVYDRHENEDWHKHCGPYSTFEQAKDWINGIREA